MAEAQKPRRHHTVQIEERGMLKATGVSQVDFFSDELITARTDLGLLHIKGEGLHPDPSSDQWQIPIQQFLPHRFRDPAHVESAIRLISSVRLSISA